jgi:hypothetical protein
VDESGDYGEYVPGEEKTGSPYFILAGLIIDSSKWRIALDSLKTFRKSIAKQAYLDYDIEFHCAEMINPRKIKVYDQINIADRWLLIRQFADTIGTNAAFKIISVVIDKSKDTLNPEEYSTYAVTKLYQAYDEFLKSQTSYGITFFDRANEKNITTHVRRLIGTGATGSQFPNLRIGSIIEDPLFKTSSDSMFIQAADVVVYTLKEKEFPLTSRKKYNADRIFANKLGGIIYKPKLADEDGIIRA